jgi:hypothetical protein
MLLLYFGNGLNHNLNLKRTSPRLFLNRFYVLYVATLQKKLNKNTTIRRAQNTHILGHSFHYFSRTRKSLHIVALSRKEFWITAVVAML